MKIDAKEYMKADAENKGKLLAKAYGLAGHQMWKHKQSGKWIISHAGIQSIAAQEEVIVEYMVISVAADHAVLMAQIKDGQATFGEATPANCQMKYYVAMAEKRAFDRCVLIHILRDVGGYGADFYGEDEADNFAKPKDSKVVKDTADALGMEAQEVLPKADCLKALGSATNGEIIELYRVHMAKSKTEKWHQELVDACAARKDEVSNE